MSEHRSDVRLSENLVDPISQMVDRQECTWNEIELTPNNT